MNQTIILNKNLTLDIASHKAMIGSKILDLTLKEFSLLEYLMRNHGRVLTRMDILEQVWGVDADPFTNTVETHVVNLRKKLGDQRKKMLIRTVSGVGYMMD